MTRAPRIFCAIDTPDLGRALALAKTVGPVTGGLKLGLEFFNAFGPAGIEEVQKAAPAAALFVDLKYHDIPNTVAAAVKTLSHRIRPAYLNVHASGGIDMMRAARDACHPDTKLLAVTVLTSLQQDDLISIAAPLEEYVESLALRAREAGLEGVVCSSHEIQRLRAVTDEDFILMVPGIRLEGADRGDQKRIMTPARALAAGATHLVIGRPITGAPDPAEAAKKIAQTIAL